MYAALYKRSRFEKALAHVCAGMQPGPLPPPGLLDRIRRLLSRNGSGKAHHMD